ncbi:MAG: FAD-dependent oxidoreductase [Actinobacteria bacterium]|nr:FAD-dependent oxidoreductase [Actinomycetota bacterium]
MSTGSKRPTSSAPRVGKRETRRIVGDYVLTNEDVLGSRTFDDCIARSP